MALLNGDFEHFDESGAELLAGKEVAGCLRCLSLHHCSAVCSFVGVVQPSWLLTLWQYFGGNVCVDMCRQLATLLLLSFDGDKGLD